MHCSLNNFVKVTSIITFVFDKYQSSLHVYLYVPPFGASCSVFFFSRKRLTVELYIVLLSCSIAINGFVFVVYVLRSKDLTR